VNVTISPTNEPSPFQWYRNFHGDGESGEGRITEEGERRRTEEGERRTLEDEAG
jgi:hypothetical protein